MDRKIVNYVSKLRRQDFTNNVQRVLYTLLTTAMVNGSDGWVSRTAFRVPSAASRVRDLRKEQFGGFDVMCRSASSLGRRGDQHTFLYKINQRNLTLARVRRVFEGV